MSNMAAGYPTSELTPVALPILQPLPIPTRGLPWYQAYFNWLFYRRDYRLAEDWIYRLPTGELICIRADFVFDGASIPRFAWLFLTPIGILLIPGLLHDYAYKFMLLRAPDGTVAIAFPTRRSADRMFLEVCHITNGLLLLDLLCTLIVRLFGGIAWRQHRLAQREQMELSE